MIPSAGDELAVKWPGFVIALAAFVVTRGFLVSPLFEMTTVTGAITGLAPLVLGLGIALYGVDLAVSTHEPEYVRTVAAWYLLGTVGMLLIVGLPALAAVDSTAALLTNEAVGAAIVGGGLGGLLVGSRTGALKRQQRQLERRADQAELVNHLLRHQILNAMTAIKGHAGLIAEGRGTETSHEVIEESAARITQTVEDVGFIIRTGGEDAPTGTVDVREAIEDALDRLPPAVQVSRTHIPPVTVRGDSHLGTALTELLQTAGTRGDRPSRIAVSTTSSTADIEIWTPGDWLSDREARVLTERLPAYDSPEVGYALAITNLLVTQYRGSILVETSEDGTSVILRLPRTRAGVPSRDRAGIGVEGLAQAAVAGVVAGVGMGLVLQFLAGGVGIIGALYGNPTSVVGWITHLFHSVVFATVFLAAGSHPRLARWVYSPWQVLGLAVGFGILLWLGAAGIIMSLWLNAVGIQATIPNLDPVSLVGHVVWGLLLGLSLWGLPTTAK